MARQIRNTDPLVPVVVELHNELKRDFGTADDPGHTHTAGAITIPKQRVQEHLGPLAAPEDVTLHAQIAAGAELNVTTGFTAMCPARTVRLKRGGAGNATEYTITGTRFGAPQVEVVNSDGASDIETTKAFDTITSITSDVDPDVTTDVVSGAGFGLGAPFSDLDAVGVDGEVEAPDSSDGPSGTVVPTTPPDGTAVFVVRYRVQPTATQADTGSAITGISAVVGASTKVHLDVPERLIVSANATNLTTSLKLVNEMRAVWQTKVGHYPGHVNDLLAHHVADETNVTEEPAATDLDTAVDLANDLKAKFNAHLDEEGVHLNDDTNNTVGTTDATDQDSLNTLLNALKAAMNAHFADGLPAASARLIDA